MRHAIAGFCWLAACVQPAGLDPDVFGPGTGTTSTTSSTTTDATSSDASTSTDDGADETSSGGSSSSEGDASTSTGAAIGCGSGRVEPGELCFVETADEIPMGPHALDIAIGDYDRDGNLDIVTLDATTPAVWVMHGDGARGFDAPTSIDVTSEAFRLIGDDFDGDGHADFVVLGSDMTIVYNDAGGLAPATVPSSGLFVDALNDAAVGAFDTTPGLDIVHTNQHSAYFQQGTSGAGGWTFEASTIISLTEGLSGLARVAFSFDNDVIDDLVVLHRDQSYAEIRLATGGGTFIGFGQPTVCPLGAGGYRAAVGDLDGDGNEDLVVTCETDRWARVMGNGDGTFADPVFQMIGTAFVPAIADLDQDGDADIAISAVSFGSVVLVINDGAGGYAVGPTLDTVGEMWTFAIADLDADGGLDIAATLNTAAGGHAAIFWSDP